MVANAFLGLSATIVGLMAGWIAVGGFIGHVRPSLSGGSDLELRRGTTIGGVAGLGFAVLTIVVSVVLG
jgi:hypothetical protein